MTDLPKLHIAVLMGGWSSERPVSLMSGKGVADALEARGHKVTRVDLGETPLGVSVTAPSGDDAAARRRGGPAGAPR